MPQMSPMNWLLLFMFFSMMLMLFNIMNYYLINPLPMKHYIKNSKMNSLNWKW
uniref:ATP synthase complex subunit 8 n=1 Tax=Taeniochauliodes attenuatus TaxID=2900206 RepID=A0A8K2ATI9_9NEOP|nr:ATP synthase F0 subunit 8 [Taeniochauliodes attenuatus]